MQGHADREVAITLLSCIGSRVNLTPILLQLHICVEYFIYLANGYSI